MGEELMAGNVSTSRRFAQKTAESRGRASGNSGLELRLGLDFELGCYAKDCCYSTSINTEETLIHWSKREYYLDTPSTTPHLMFAGNRNASTPSAPDIKNYPRGSHASSSPYVLEDVNLAESSLLMTPFVKR